MRHVITVRAADSAVLDQALKWGSRPAQAAAPAPAAAARAEPPAKVTPAAALAALAEAHNACAALVPEAETRAASADALETAREQLQSATKRLGTEPAEEDLQRALRRRRALDAAVDELTKARAEAHYLAFYTSRPPPAALAARPALTFATCHACRTDVADVASVPCAYGHYNCVACLSARLASAAGSQVHLTLGADVPCFAGCGGVLDAATVMRALVAHGDADGAAHAVFLAARAARLAGRVDACAEQAEREAMTLPQRLIDQLQGLRCPACSLLYDHTTEGTSCMHASCSACGTAFCGFCFCIDCAAEECPLNRQRPNVLCSNKAAAFVYCHAFQLAQLLRASGASAAERKAALDAAAPALAAASRPEAAVLDPSSLTLVTEARGVNYATLLVNNALQAAYGGISGAEVPPIVFSALERDDCVRLISDVALLRAAFSAEGFEAEWQEHAALLTVNPQRIWRIEAVNSACVELRPLDAAAESPTPTVPFFALAKHAPATAVVRCLATGASDPTKFSVEVGDAVYIGHDPEALSRICMEVAPDGSPPVGWTLGMAALSCGWALVQKPYPLARGGGPRGLVEVVCFGAADDAEPGQRWYLPPHALTRVTPAVLVKLAVAKCFA